ncbi:MAG: hypothetical protein WCP65_06290 [Bacteroidota bacterium]|jgi:hypothetical protein
MKKISISTLLSVVLFFVLIVATSKFQTTYHEGDKFGWPFVFFSAYNNHEFVTDQSFSILNFVLDLAVCFGVGFAVATVLGKLKHQKAA